MYLHIGNNLNIREKNIIGIFDADTATISSTTKKYLSRAQADGKVSFAAEKLPKSFVVYRTPKGVKVCFSQLSSSALAGRTE